MDRVVVFVPPIFPACQTSQKLLPGFTEASRPLVVRKTAKKWQAPRVTPFGKPVEGNESSEKAAAKRHLALSVPRFALFLF